MAKARKAEADDDDGISTKVWMPLVIGDYLKDTTHLNTEQHGAYLLLIFAAWTRPNGELPDDDEQLAQIARTPLARWKAKLRPIIQTLFKTGDGMWRHKRISLELQQAKRRKAKAVAKARQAADARWERERHAQQEADQAAASTTQTAPDPTSHPVDNPVDNDAPSNAPSNAPSMGPGMLGAMHKQCPSSSSYVLPVVGVTVEDGSNAPTAPGDTRPKTTPSPSGNGHESPPRAPPAWRSDPTAAMTYAQRLHVTAAPGESMATVIARIDKKLADIKRRH